MELIFLFCIYWFILTFLMLLSGFLGFFLTKEKLGMLLFQLGTAIIILLLTSPIVSFLEGF